ncbi:MAG: serine hydrolase domain-containing protein [Umezawaea sp.]
MRKSTLPLALTAAGLAVIAALPVAHADLGRGPSDQATRARVAELAQRAVDAGNPGVIVRFDDGRSPVEITKQAPWTTKDHRLAATDEFRVGSNTKTVVAALVLQLVGEGRVGLDDPVGKWLPGLVPGGSGITLRMLLNHTSGLGDFVDDPAVIDSVFGRSARKWTSRELLAAGTALPPTSAPGTEWHYSNTNYIAIGMVLEKATGRHLADLVDQRIARPLRLKHTYFATDATWRGRHATGYEPDAAHLEELLPPGAPDGLAFVGPEHDEHVDVSGIDPGWGWAAGAVVSTAAEWGRFQTALLSGELLAPAQLEQLRTVVPMGPGAPEGAGYGLGIARLATPCGVVWGHVGGIPGYLTKTYTDDGGTRSVAVVDLTYYGETAPKADEANKALETAAVCAMFDKPVPES